MGHAGEEDERGATVTAKEISCLAITPHPYPEEEWFDRAQQALCKLGLEPVAECTGEANSYGFRPERSAHDAAEQVFNALRLKSSAQWILEGDIKACFDEISHE